MPRAVVVGGSSDIGAAIAEELAALGHDVEVWGRDGERLAAATRRCSRHGVAARAVVVDLLDRAALDRAVADATRTAVDVLVWAAGVFDWASTEDADPAVWREVLEVNLVAAAVVTAGLSNALLLARPGSALVYIGSGAARQAFPNNAAYVASKHGLAGLADAVRLDLGPRGVRVCLVSPGLVAAGAGLRSPQGRSDPGSLLTPADVARAVRSVVASSGGGGPVEVILEPPRLSPSTDAETR